MVASVKFGKFDTVDFQQFVDCWENDPACGLARWSRKQGNVTMREGVLSFYKLAKKSAEHARWVHYHIGWIFDDEIRNDLIQFVAKDSVQALYLYIEDATITDQQAFVLEKSFTRHDTGCPNLVNEFCEQGKLKRKAASEYNEESEIVEHLKSKGWL